MSNEKIQTLLNAMDEKHGFIFSRAMPGPKIAQIQTSKASFSHLGGGSTNRIGATTAYEKLRCPANLLPSRCSLKDKEVKKAYLKMYEGDFGVAWCASSRCRIALGAAALSIATS